MELKIALITYWIPMIVTFIVFTRWEEMHPMSLGQRICLAVIPMFNFMVAFLTVTFYLVEKMEAGWRKLGEWG